MTKQKPWRGPLTPEQWDNQKRRSPITISYLVQHMGGVTFPGPGSKVKDSRGRKYVVGSDGNLVRSDD